MQAEIIISVSAMKEVKMFLHLRSVGVEHRDCVHGALVGAVGHELLALSCFSGFVLLPDLTRQVVGPGGSVGAEEHLWYGPSSLDILIVYLY